MITNHPHAVRVFLAEHPDELCFEWQFGAFYHPLITARDHAQIEREFGSQGGTLVALV